MKPLFAAALAGLCTATAAMAALPPFHASAWMMQTIMASEAVDTAVKGGFVEGLELLGTTEAGAYQWRVRTRDCSVTVVLQPQPMPTANGTPMVGRVDYDVTEVSACTAD